MADEVPHPAVERVRRALDRDELTVYALAERGNVAAVVVQDDVARYVVFVERRDDEWVVPDIVGGGGQDVVTQRPSKTESSSVLHRLAIEKSGPPDAGGGPPDIAWCAVTGTAALDAVEVIVATDSDMHSTTVRPDGFVLAVVRAGWRESPSITVRTRDGRQLTDHGS